MASKRDRSVNACIGKPRFPVIRALEEFDFCFQPEVSAARIRELAESGFLSRAEKVALVGRPGVGKTHLAIASALCTCEAGRRVLFVSANELLDHLLASEVSRSLSNYIL